MCLEDESSNEAFLIEYEKAIGGHRPFLHIATKGRYFNF